MDTWFLTSSKLEDKVKITPNSRSRSVITVSGSAYPRYIRITTSVLIGCDKIAESFVG